MMNQKRGLTDTISCTTTGDIAPLHGILCSKANSEKLKLEENINDWFF